MNARRVEWVGLGAALLFGAVSAVAGGIGLLGGGITFPEEWLDGSPFTDYTIPGIILAVVVGGSQLVAVAALRKRLEWALPASALAGVIMMGWIASEVLIVGSNGGLMLSLQVIYFALGLAELALTARLTREQAPA